MVTNFTTISASITEEQKETLRYLSYQKAVPQTEIIRNALDYYFAHIKEDKK